MQQSEAPPQQTQNSNIPNSFYPAVIKHIITGHKPLKSSPLLWRGTALFAFRQDGGDYLQGSFLTESSKTIFQLQKTQEERELWQFAKAHTIKATLQLNVIYSSLCKTRSNCVTLNRFSKDLRGTYWSSSCLH